MSEKVLHLAPGLAIPAEDFIESATALIGKRGAGKSGGVKVLEEELFRVGLPFITLDPVGVHWGIKSSFDGKSSGLPVLVIGGLHGDLRLDRRAGAEIARAVLEANVSCVVDFSQEPKAAYREFVRDFSQEIYAKNGLPGVGARVVIIEEAPELVPQKVTGDRAQTYEAVERLTSRGRNQGIGVVLVSQRAATINKDVLTQVDNLFVGRLVGPQDRSALKEWVEAWDAKDRLAEFERALPSLPTRTMWLWSPEKLKHFGPVRFKDFKTLHADKTHLRRLGLLEARPVTTDVSSVVTKLGKQLERLSKERADTARIPRLEAEIRRLTADLAKRTAPVQHDAGPSRADAKRAVDEAVAPIRAERDALRSALREANGRLRKWNAMAASAWDAISKYRGEGGPVDLPGAAGGTAGAATRPQHAVERSQPAPKPAAPPPALPGAPQHYQRPPETPEQDDGGPPRPKAGAVRMLQELASRHPLTLTYAQLATLAGFTPSGGTATTYFSVLKRAGYLEEDRQGNVTVTDAGREFLGADVPPPPSTHEEIMERWRAVLKAGTYKMLEAAAKRFPDSITDEDLGAETGFAIGGGTYGTYRGILVRNGLVEVDGHEVRATKILFPEL